jgi:hypothetical protein
MNYKLNLNELLNKYYNQLKSFALNILKFINNKDVALDIFHNILESMLHTMKDKLVTLNEVKSYLSRALKVSYYRELQYARNRYNSNEEINDNDYFYELVIDDKLMLKSILKEIRNSFKVSECLLYIKYIKGYTYRELNKLYNITNSFQIVKKMNNYIKKIIESYNK